MYVASNITSPSSDKKKKPQTKPSENPYLSPT